MSDPYHLQRFVRAQEVNFESAREELRRGRKTTHWIWYVYPQVEGLGRSSTSQHFAIKSRQEALAYLAHPVLGPRLKECTGIVNALDGLSANQIFGSPDDMKFRSSMTLFHTVSPDIAVFKDALEKYFGGELDPRTLEIMHANPSAWF
ncbi:MAG: DUF1810 domain-containing protein [Methylobacteriaceae bacterium]|nr:DUF1810 domain-containing protein [Methylobacteriaceae bacterium]MBV9395695.1 DUF1810 domain-containing protein [Methylobacteriaceae bacterium]